MKKETKKAPTIRFQGFTDDWEQRKLGDVCNQLTGAINPQTRPNELFVEYSMPAYDSGMKPNIVYGFTMNSTRKIVNESCLLINKLNVRKKRIWYIKNPTKNAVCSAEFIPLYSDNIDLLFLNYVVSRDSFTNYLEACSSGSSNSQKRVTPDIIIEAKVFLPVKDEQLKIGSYFQKIDNLITLHQRKLDHLKTLKKYFLQNMFPAKGEKVPKIRFKGFTDDWEQRKFGEIAEYKKGPFGSALKKEFFIPDSDISIKVYEQQNAINKDWTLSRYYISQEYAQKLKAFEVHSGDIIVSCAGTIGEIYELPAQARPGIINQALMRIRVNKDIVCKDIFKLAFSNMIDSLSREFSNGSAIKNIPPFADLKPMKVLLPDKTEQKLIGDFFTDIDKTITLHQRKLNQLLTMKKFMLQNLFI